MFVLRFVFFRRLAAGLLTALLCPVMAVAGGPEFVAGVTTFNPSVKGQPVHWANGQLNYYVDQGILSATVNHTQAVSMVEAAAALWNSVTTAGVTLTDMGSLNEDVKGSNSTAIPGPNPAQGILTAPSDVTPSATGFPVAVIFDADGTVINAIYGQYSSDPYSCQNNGVFFWIDGINPDATFSHGVILLNGLCATTAKRLDMMSFELERAFGRLLGLDYSQVNPGALTNKEVDGTLGWPIMEPYSGVCSNSGGDCVPDPTVLRWDDIAALNRLYPITAANLSSFPGKQLTAPNTFSIQGPIAFKNGTGMQGVNVVARPLDPLGNPVYEYTATAVSGALFNGNHGSPVTGWTDVNGNLLSMWGSDDPAQQGAFDLSFMPMPLGVALANYQLTFESIDPNDINDNAVGPYIDGSPAPSGTLSLITITGATIGNSLTENVTVADSAAGGPESAIGSEANPRALPASGMWSGRLGQIGQTDWFSFPVRGGRAFTVVTEALDETGAPSNSKAMPSLGLWDAFEPVGSVSSDAEAGFDGVAVGESLVQADLPSDDIIRLGIADERGDGRPDYAYQGWVLYAATVQPMRLPAAGGPIVIDGMGFRMTDTVAIGGQAAIVTSITPNEITAIVPAAQNGITGSVDVEVDDMPVYASAVISGGVSYDSATGDALTLMSTNEPSGTEPIGVPQPFSVIALGSNGVPAGSVTVTFTVTSGTATLGCGQSTCIVTTTGDGRAAMDLTAVDTNLSIVTASLTNGSSLQAQFRGGTPPVLANISPMLSVAAGATVTWTVEALALNNGLPLSNQSVAWQSASGITASGNGALTNGSGIATQTLTVGPLTEGQTATSTACLNGSAQCVPYTAFGAHPELATLVAVSGTSQSLTASEIASQITLRVLDTDGNPMAGGTVTLYQAIYAWTPPCAPHGRCAQPELLSSQTATATSAIDGTVTFAAASIAGVATNTLGLAVTGDTGSVSITIEQHP